MATRTESAHVEGTGETPVPSALVEQRAVEGPASSSWTEAESRQLSRLLVAGFLLLLVPATIAWCTGWRWRPWPPGPQGYGSIVSEAREAANTYVPFAFMGW